MIEVNVHDLGNKISIQAAKNMYSTVDHHYRHIDDIIMMTSYTGSPVGREAGATLRNMIALDLCASSGVSAGEKHTVTIEASEMNFEKRSRNYSR